MWLPINIDVGEFRSAYLVKRRGPSFPVELLRKEVMPEAINAGLLTSLRELMDKISNEQFTAFLREKAVRRNLRQMPRSCGACLTDPQKVVVIGYRLATRPHPGRAEIISTQFESARMQKRGAPQVSPSNNRALG